VVHEAVEQPELGDAEVDPQPGRHRRGTESPEIGFVEVEERV
jgi:hypothetical protein